MFSSPKNFDWKKSKAHLLMLSKFVYGQEVQYFVKWGNWEKVLSEPPEKAIKRFIEEGMVINADLETLVSYKYKVTKLKDLLKERKLTVSGTKDELVQRLIQADKEGMMKSVAGIELLTCTKTGCELAEKYVASEREKRIDIEKQVVGYLSKRMFQEASLTVANYEAEQVFSRGIGIDWENYNPDSDIDKLKSIFNEKPEILSKLSDEKIEPLRICAAMMELWGENKGSRWLPSNYETGLSIDNDSAARMLLFSSQNNETLKRYGKSGVQNIEILPAPDSCESCKKLEGKRYKVDEAPKLPNPNCTHNLGCRCVYLPCVD